MSKFCGSCGSQIADNATFCPNCGASAANAPAPTPAPAATQQTPYVQPTAAPAQNNNSKMIGIALVGVVVLVLIFVLFGSLFGGGYKKPIAKMCKGLEKEDWKIYSECLPKDQKKAIGNKRGKDIIKKAVEFMEDEYGKNIKISYKVTDKEKLDKDDIDDLEDNFKKRYDKKIKISKAYELEVKLTIKGKDDKDSDEVDFVVAKVDGKWVILEGGLV